MPKREKRKLPFAGRAVFLCAAGVLLAAQPFTAYANDKKITSVRLEFACEERDEEGLPIVTPETSSSRFSVDEVYTMEEYVEYLEDTLDSDDDDDDDDIDDVLYDLITRNDTYLSMEDMSELIYVAVLEAEEGYYFSLDKEDVRAEGLGAECLDTDRRNSKETLDIFLKFGDLDDLVGEVEEVSWLENGSGVWKAAPGASKYELTLYFEGKVRAREKITAALSYDFNPYMQTAGAYSYRVRPISAIEESGEWVSSGEFSVSEEMAAKNREAYEVMTEALSGSGPQAGVRYLNTGWQETADGSWWYRENDGGYPQAAWLFDGECWCYFDERGYLVQNSYIKWGRDTYYVGADGRMYTGGQTPDGRIAQPGGELKWPDV